MMPRVVRRSAELLSMSALSLLGAASMGLIGGAALGEALGSAGRSFGVFCLAPLLLWFIASLVLAALRRSRTDRELFRWELLTVGIALALAVGIWVLNAFRDPFEWSEVLLAIALQQMLILALIAVIVLMVSRLVFTSREPAAVHPIAEFSSS